MDKLQTKSIVRQINRLFANEVSQNSPHILDCETEYDPRIEAFWLIGNMPPYERLIKTRKHLHYKPTVSKEVDPIHNKIQYFGEPLVQLRSPLPLREIVSIEESEDPSMEVPEFKYYFLYHFFLTVLIIIIFCLLLYFHFKLIIIIITIFTDTI